MFNQENRRCISQQIKKNSKIRKTRNQTRTGHETQQPRREDV